MKDLKEQLREILSKRFYVFGALGKYDKPKYTKSGRERKNRVFDYPYKGELLELFDLLEKDFDNDKEFVTHKIMSFVRRTEDDFIVAKDHYISRNDRMKSLEKN